MFPRFPFPVSRYSINMKSKILTILFLAMAVCASSQNTMSGKSYKKKVKIKSSGTVAPIKELPDLIITGESFQDNNGNNFIDAGETSEINLTVQNIGKGTAQGVEVITTVKNGNIPGLQYEKSIKLGDIEPNASKDVHIAISAENDVPEGLAEFNIEVLEIRGFDAYPLIMKVETKEFATPNLILADAAFSTEDGGMIKLNYPIVLEVIVQNIGQGYGNSVIADFTLPNANCFPLGEKTRYSLENLAPGESKKLEYLFTASRRYTLDNIPVRVKVTETTGRFTKDTVLKVGLEQRLIARNEVAISGRETTAPSIAIASLSADIDKNIPKQKKKYPYRYALIIGNEDYSRYQRGIASESNVDYARTDAKIFKEYAVQTLGVEPTNCFLLLDATAGELLQKIDLVSKLAAKTPHKSEIIFYYAGHGLPDENTKEPYLIPVDVSGTNLSAAVKLEEIYKKFSEAEAKRVTVFLDACFSGGGRESGLMAARGVKVKPKSNLITGNMVVFSASSGEQSALPYKAKEHGMFTYYLLKKIQDSKGQLNYEELSEYVTSNVSIQSLKINQKEQDPKVNVSVDVQDEWKQWTFH